MAERRTIYRVMFSENEQVAELSHSERLLYIGMIVFADDDGRLKASGKVLKALVFPFDDGLRAIDVSKWRDKIAYLGLITLYAVGGQEYAYHPNWRKWQTIRADRYHPSDCPLPVDDKTESATIPPPGGNQSATETNLNEPKQNETKKSTRTREGFVRPTPQDVEEYSKSIGFALDGNAFCDYYEARGWKYKGGVAMKDWKAAVRTWKTKRGDFDVGKSGSYGGFKKGDNTAGTVDVSKYEKAGIPD